MNVSSLQHQNKLQTINKAHRETENLSILIPWYMYLQNLDQFNRSEHKSLFSSFINYINSMVLVAIAKDLQKSLELEVTSIPSYTKTERWLHSFFTIDLLSHFFPSKLALFSISKCSCLKWDFLGCQHWMVSFTLSKLIFITKSITTGQNNSFCSYKKTFIKRKKYMINHYKGHKICFLSPHPHPGWVQV